MHFSSFCSPRDSGSGINWFLSAILFLNYGFSCLSGVRPIKHALVRFIFPGWYLGSQEPGLLCVCPLNYASLVSLGPPGQTPVFLSQNFFLAFVRNHVDFALNPCSKSCWFCGARRSHYYGLILIIFPHCFDNFVHSDRGSSGRGRRLFDLFKIMLISRFVQDLVDVPCSDMHAGVFFRIICMQWFACSDICSYLTRMLLCIHVRLAGDAIEFLLFRTKNNISGPVPWAGLFRSPSGRYCLSCSQSFGFSERSCFVWRVCRFLLR